MKVAEKMVIELALNLFIIYIFASLDHTHTHTHLKYYNSSDQH